MTTAPHIEAMARAIMDSRLGAGSYDNAQYRGADQEREQAEFEAQAAYDALFAPVPERLPMPYSDETVDAPNVTQAIEASHE